MWREDDSPIPPVLGPFESLASELKIMKEIMTRLPQGPGESYFEPRSYVLQSEFDAYLIDHRKQKSQLLNLEKAYAGLAKSQGELSISHSKMKKREKSKDKFFIRMWKGDKDELDASSDDGRDEDSEATDTNGEG
ncbi:hypothetical protein H5410_040743 [Solanum commersonii]|uniref:Uncharacterized protein n=1 Tax=Solanum commersonii TaxID=4109 RepID=A0A9J5XR06_SOLCO|nr:hypothetical protein H5410_040743 [Solanum commersonii]